MSLATQKQLAKGYEARDMQYAGRGKIMQLEAVVLQKPSEEWMDWKSDASYQIGDKAHSLPPDGLGKFSA